MKAVPQAMAREKKLQVSVSKPELITNLLNAIDLPRPAPLPAELCLVVQ